MKKKIKSFKSKVFYLSLVVVLIALLPLFVVLEKIGVKKDFSSLLSGFLKRGAEKVNAQCGCAVLDCSCGGDGCGDSDSCGNGEG